MRDEIGDSDHSIELSTRNVIATAWTGLRIRCSLLEDRELEDMDESGSEDGQTS
jgi:hypothetical protein